MGELGAGDAHSRGWQRDTTARIGIDVGGTFTDVVYGTEGESAHHIKTLTTPADITEGILAGVAKVGADVRRLRVFLHGTTVALNAFLQGRTRPVGLITTAGFRDVLEIMRTDRPNMYDLQQVKPPPLVARRHRREISARVTAAGEELEPVSDGEVESIADDFIAAGIEDIAVCLMHSYAFPAHERRVREILAEARPHLAVSISSDLTREWREFERTSTTVINAATMPIMAAYLARLEHLLIERGFAGELLIMQSSGGAMAAGDASTRPAATLMSGPIGGVARAQELARMSDEQSSLVTFDMGGTSVDVAIVDRGRAVHTPEAKFAGWPILMPSVQIESIGAGGGSISYVDPQGGLHVGPESAGSSPGPACYGLGGKRATVTDANLVLGRIDGARFLDGDFPLDLEAAREAIRRDVAEPLGMTVEQAAAGIVRVVDSHMSRLLREVLIRRGYDPRTFTLLAFGGGGPLHGCSLAREAGVRRVVVPLHPGTLSAYGIYGADVRQDLQAMFIGAASGLTDDELESAFGELEAEVGDPGADGSRAHEVTRAASLRYLGQEYTLEIDGSRSVAVQDYVSRFHAEHARLYGFDRPAVGVEFVKLSVSGTLRTGLRGSGPASLNGGGGEAPRSRTVWHAGVARPVSVLERDLLSSGQELPCPCIVEESGATTYVPPGWNGRVDDQLNMVFALDDHSIDEEVAE